MAALERQRKYEYPARFTPKGLTDALDATDKFPGACVNLANLVFDHANPELMVARPGVTTIVDLLEGSNYVNLTGSFGGYVSTPDSAALDITGSIEFIIYLAATDWTPGGLTSVRIVAKNTETGADMAYSVRIGGTGIVSFVFSLNGTSTNTANPGVVLPATDGVGQWIRVTRNSATGVCTFSYSNEAAATAPTDVTFIQYGTDTQATGAMFAGTSALTIGAGVTGLSNFQGKIYSVSIYDGIGGTLAASMVANDTAQGSSSWASLLTGETYTLNGTASIVGPQIVSPDVISVFATIGSVTYGMVASGLNSGKDQPFAYDHAAGEFLTVTGITNSTTPTTQPYAGPWTPPTMASVGIYLIVTHPGFADTSHKFGYFDLTVPTAPTWTAGDTATNALPSVPNAVANFNNRAYFACDNFLPYTDSLTLTRTSVTQQLTIGDTSPITALSGLPVQTTSSGIVQALLIFKDFQIWQVTGDATGSTLAQNFLSLTEGCASPRSIAATSSGVYFASISGPKLVNQFGSVRSVTHSDQQLEPDVQTGWMNTVVPSRVAGGYSGTIYRVSMETIIGGEDLVNDYWFDEHRRRWCGPHTFEYDCVSQIGNYFVLCSNDDPAKLFKSESAPSVNSSYDDVDATMTCTLQSSTFPKTGHMTVKQVIESTQELAASSAAGSFDITALDEQGAVLDNCSITVPAPGTLWGSGVWGAFNWGSGVARPRTYTVPWTQPLVFKKLALQMTAEANGSLSFGSHFARYKEAGYSNTPTP